MKRYQYKHHGSIQACRLRGQVISGVLLLLVTLIPAVVRAEVTIKEYQEAKTAGGPSWDATKLYVFGVGQGIKFANGLLKAEHLPQLFCRPSSSAFTADDYLAILDRELSRNLVGASAHIEVLLVVAMRRTYPCGDAL